MTLAFTLLVLVLQSIWLCQGSPLYQPIFLDNPSTGANSKDVAFQTLCDQPYPGANQGTNCESWGFEVSFNSGQEARVNAITGEKPFGAPPYGGGNPNPFTFSVASTAARQSEGHKVVTLDTMTLSCGQRFQVLAAAMGLKAGWTLEKIIERLSSIRAQSDIIYTLETLEYLQRGGRIGRVQALAGSILGIKPIIKIDKNDGKYSTVGRGRSVTQTMATMAGSLKATYGDKPVWATVVHGQFAEKAEAFAKLLKETLNIAKLDVLRISPVLGVHTGPGIVGAGIVPMAEFDGLL